MEPSERPGTQNTIDSPGDKPVNSQIPFTASDLPMNGAGNIYHLQVRPEHIAPDVLIVGDPHRAEFIGARFLRDVEFEHEHRGLITVTGTSVLTGERATVLSPQRTTAATSGIGTSSLEIVVGELVALNEIDFKTRTRKTDFPRMHFIRVGTSGGLQPSTALGTPIITTYGIGLDNTGLYYEAPYPDGECQRLERELAQVINLAMSKNSRFYGKIHPYVSRAEPTLVGALVEAAKSLGVTAKKGLTVSAPGFFAPQGRDISRLKPSVPEMDKIFTEFNPGLDGQRVENMEMEGSFLMHFLGGMGYWAGVICPAIANRRQDTFTPQYQQAVENATRVALLALASLRKSNPED